MRLYHRINAKAALVVFKVLYPEDHREFLHEVVRGGETSAGVRIDTETPAGAAFYKAAKQELSRLNR